MTRLRLGHLYPHEMSIYGDRGNILSLLDRSGRRGIDLEVVEIGRDSTDVEDIDIFFLGRAHTGGDLSVGIPRQKILFLSETFLNRVFPAMRSAYPTEWLKALDRAEAAKADIYIAGHGFTESGPVSKEELREFHQALQAVIAEATRLHNTGLSVDEAIKQAHFGTYADWTLAKSQAPIAIRKVYDELDGKLK